MPEFSVLVPYRPDGGERDRAWAFNRARWEACFPNAEIIVESPGEGAHPGEFNHPKAINEAAKRARSDRLIVADADVTFDDPTWVEFALWSLDHKPWVLPRYYVTMTPYMSNYLTDGWEGEGNGGSLHVADTETCREWTGDSVSWAGLIFLPRKSFEKTGGYDERFSWWGADDVAFGVTMEALWGHHFRVDGAVLHFWHPTPLEHNYGHEEHRRQDKLMRAYLEAAVAYGPEGEMIGSSEQVEAVRFGTEAIA